MPGEDEMEESRGPTWLSWCWQGAFSEWCWWDLQLGELPRHHHNEEPWFWSPGILPTRGSHGLGLSTIRLGEPAHVKNK